MLHIYIYIYIYIYICVYIYDISSLRVKLYRHFCYFLRLSSKYSPERPILEHPPLTLSSCDSLWILLLRIRLSLGAVISTAVRTCPELDQSFLTLEA